MKKTFILLLISIIALCVSVYKTEETKVFDCGRVLLMTQTSNKHGMPKYFISTKSKTGEVQDFTYVQYKVGDNFCWSEIVVTQDVWYYLMVVSLICSVILILILFNLHNHYFKRLY